MVRHGLSFWTCTDEGVTNRPCALLFVTLVKVKRKAFHFQAAKPKALHRISTDNRWATNRAHLFRTKASSYSLILWIKSNIWIGTHGQTSYVYRCDITALQWEGIGCFFHPNVHLLTWIWAIEIGIRGTVWSCCMPSGADTSDRLSVWLHPTDMLAASVTQSAAWLNGWLTVLTKGWVPRHPPPCCAWSVCSWCVMRRAIGSPLSQLLQFEHIWRRLRDMRSKWRWRGFNRHLWEGHKRGH